MSSLKLKSLFIDNWPAKVLSLACALALFIFHRMSSLEERFFSAPLKIENDGGMAPASAYPHTIRVTLRGTANNVFTVIDNDIEVFIDLGNPVEGGVGHFPVRVRKKGTAEDAGTLEINVDPMEITLELDERVSKFVALKPRLQGETAVGYEIASYNLNPSRIRIDGPDRLLRRIQELPTGIIDISARNADFTVITRALNNDPLITIQGDSVIEYRAEVRPLFIIRSIDAVPIDADNLAPGLAFSAEPAYLSLRVEGPQNALEGWKPVVTKKAAAVRAAFVDESSANLPFTETAGSAGAGLDEPPDLTYTRSSLYVDCSGITMPGEYELEVKADIPANFALLGTANQASALNAALPTVKVTISAIAAD